MSKELSIEEKAQAYDKAIEIINDYYQKIKYSSLSNASADREVIEKAFPQLKESEDERIKGAIIDHLKDNNLIEWATWLEKQVVQKEIDYNEELKKCKDNPLYFFDKYVKVKFKEHKYTWSEEDIKCLNRISLILLDASEVKQWWKEYRLIEKDEMEKLTNWLKSLKERIGNFDDGYKVGFSAAKYNQWKPSKEQLHYLYWIANINLGDSVVEQEVSRHLNELYEDLKKLRDAE